MGRPSGARPVKVPSNGFLFVGGPHPASGTYMHTKFIYVEIVININF